MKNLLLKLFIVLAVAAGYSCSRKHQDSSADEKAAHLLEEGSAMMERGRTDSARLLYNEALELTPRPNDTILGYIYAEISTSYINDGDMPRALENGKRALDYCEGVVGAEDFGVLAGNIGMIYRRLGHNDSAALFYRRGLDMAIKEPGAGDVTAYLLNNLSVLYCEMERYDEAIGFARKGQTYAQEGNDSTEYWSAKANEGIALSKSGKNTDAAPILKSVFEAARRTGNTQLLLKTVNYGAALARELGDPVLRGEYLDAGAEAVKEWPAENVASQGIREARMKYLYDRGNYRGALAIAEGFDSLSVSSLAMPIYKLRQFEADCHAALGEPGVALGLLKESLALRDSVTGEDVERQLSEYSVKFKTMETEIRLLEEENLSRKRMMWLWVAIAGIVVLISILTVWIIQSGARRAREEREHEVEKTRRYVEGLEAERARMAREIHDGACNDLLGVALGVDAGVPAATTAGKVREIRGSLRRMSHELLPPDFRYADLSEIVQDYVDSLVVPDSMEVALRIEGGEWDTLDSGISFQFYRMIQEAVSNAIRHSGATSVEVTLSNNGEELRTTISDNGNRADSSRLEKGLYTLRDRAAGIEATVETSVTNSGPAIIISRPKNKNGV